MTTAAADNNKDMNIVHVQTPYPILLHRGISGIYYFGRKREAHKRGRHCYYSCDSMGYKIPLHPYTSIQRDIGQCTAFYHNPLTYDVWLVSTESGEPSILHDKRLASQILYNQI